MFVTVVNSENHCETIVSTLEGKDRVCFGEGELQDLSEAQKVYKLVKMAYNAGKSGEPITITFKKQVDITT